MYDNKFINLKKSLKDELFPNLLKITLHKISRILFQLHDWNFRGKLPIFIKIFLTNRFFKIKVGNHLSTSYTQENNVSEAPLLTQFCSTLPLIKSYQQSKSL